MLQVSEYVSLGHPDKIADYISEYLLDRYIEQDPDTRYAVEVQIKGFNVNLAGEVSSKVRFKDAQIAEFVRQAVSAIGYTHDYMEKWGRENTICGRSLNVNTYICQQSPDIAQGLARGWGDQGIFFGFADKNDVTYHMSLDYYLAKHLSNLLMGSGLGGLDIKTQVSVEDNRVRKVIVAIPLQDESKTASVEVFVRRSLMLADDCEVIINGTGKYLQHSTIADCGITGRKLAVDMYGGSCRIGGGSPWTKDGSKADLTLNLFARQIALQNAFKHGCACYSTLACCIGRKEVEFSVLSEQGEEFDAGVIEVTPNELKSCLGLNKPIFADLCRNGLFGEGAQGNPWEMYHNTEKDIIAK